MRSALVIIGVGLILVGAFFSAYPLVMSAGIASMLVLMLISLRGQIDRLASPLILNYSYWMISGFLVGAIGLDGLSSYDFFVGEGRIFVYYIPLIAFCVIRVDEKTLHRTRWILTTLVVLGGFLLVAAVVSPSLVRHVQQLTHGFASSHHALGYLYGVLVVYYLVDLLDGSRKAVLPLILSGFVVMASGSRTTMIAIALAVMWLLWRRKRIGEIIGVALIGLIVSVYAASQLEHFERRVLQLFSLDLAKQIVEQFRYTSSTFEPGVENVSDRDIIGPEHNVLTRVALWASATKNFLNSPVLGMGFGRPNDEVTEFSGARGVVWMATAGQRNLSEATAHNSYFQVAQETGLVGLVLLGWLWWSLYSRLGRIAEYWKHKGSPLISRYAEAGQGTIILVVGCGMTGHAFGSPSLGLPVLALLGATIAFDRTARSREWTGSRGATPLNGSPQASGSRAI